MIDKYAFLGGHPADKSKLSIILRKLAPFFDKNPFPFSTVLECYYARPGMVISLPLAKVTPLPRII